MQTGEYTPRVAVQDLLDAGLHFGHQTKRWNPKMKKYIHGAKNGIYIIDLEKSLQCLIEAQKFVYDVVARGRTILFIGTKKQAQEPVKLMCDKLQQPYMINRWLGGTLTNLQTIRKSVAKMRDIQRMEADGTMDKLPKKEVSSLRRELEKISFNLSGIANLETLPAAVFVIDTCREGIAVAEAVRLKVPVIAIVDTNSDPDPVDFPIPGNDDAGRAIQLILSITGETIAKAQEEYSKVAADEARRKAAEEAAQQAKTKAEAAARATAQAAQATQAKAAAEQKTRTAKPRTKKAEGEAAPAAETPAAEAPAAGEAPAAS